MTTKPNPEWIEGIDLDGIGAWQDQERPWENAEWERQRELIVAEETRIVGDQRFKDALGALAFLAVKLNLTSKPTDVEDTILRAGIDGLIRFVASESPILRHILSPEGLGRWVFALVDARVVSALGDIATAAESLGEVAGRQRVAHPGPDSPVTLLTGGDAVVPLEATDRQRLQVRDLQRARSEPGHAGRPQKAPKASPKRTPLPLDAATATASLAAWREGESQVSIGRRLAPDRSSSAQRAYAERLIRRGERIEIAQKDA